MLNRDQLMSLTQGREAELFERSIDLLVSRLRQRLRLRDDAREPRYIKTVRSGGYVFLVDGEEGWTDWVRYGNDALPGSEFSFGVRAPTFVRCGHRTAANQGAPVSPSLRRSHLPHPAASRIRTVVGRVDLKDALAAALSYLERHHEEYGVALFILPALLCPVVVISIACGVASLFR